jgi:hypothetical protein
MYQHNLDESIEFRYITREMVKVHAYGPDHYTEKTLQYRVLRPQGGSGGEWSEWMTVREFPQEKNDERP